MLEENSSRHFSDGGAEGNSAFGRIFRMRCGDVFRTQPIEITKDDFSAMHKKHGETGVLIYRAART